MRFKKRSHLCNIKVQSEAEKVDIEATAKYPENIAKTINEGSYTKTINFQCRQTAYIGRCHLGVSW